MRHPIPACAKTRSGASLRVRLLCVGLPLFLLSACISFGEEPPPTLLTLDARGAPAAGATWSGDVTDALVVEAPTLARKLSTTRIPVQIDATNLAYLTGTAWVEEPDQLFQRLLSETIAAGADRLVVDPYLAGGRQAVTLEGALIEFGAFEDSREVVLVYEAVLTGEGAQVRKRRFEAREPVSAIESGPVGEALNEAANRVAREVADWIEQAS
jgi:cholesterol transport system auxiliary component